MKVIEKEVIEEGVNTVRSWIANVERSAKKDKEVISLIVSMVKCPDSTDHNKYAYFSREAGFRVENGVRVDMTAYENFNWEVREFLNSLIRSCVGMPLDEAFPSKLLDSKGKRTKFTNPQYSRLASLRRSVEQYASDAAGLTKRKAVVSGGSEVFAPQKSEEGKTLSLNDEAVALVARLKNAAWTLEDIASVLKAALLVIEAEIAEDDSTPKENVA